MHLPQTNLLMNIPVFGTKTAKKALLKLGFIIDEKMGKGSHSIAKHPSRKPTDITVQRPFITIPNKREYYVPARNGFIKQVMLFGFSKDEVWEALFGKVKNKK